MSNKALKFPECDECNHYPVCKDLTTPERCPFYEPENTRTSPEAKIAERMIDVLALDIHRREKHSKPQHAWDSVEAIKSWAKNKAVCETDKEEDKNG
jgi:hypothetical protein